MRYLFASLASHGFVYPSIGIGQALRARGHDVAIATGPGFDPVIEQAGLERIPSGERDHQSFQVEWCWHALSVVMQVKHIEYAIERFRPDVLIGNQLTIGSFVAADRQAVPLAVLGMSAYLSPLSDALMERSPLTEDEQRIVWRYQEIVEFYNKVRRQLRLPAWEDHPEESRLLGDLFLLQSVPALEGNTDALPARVHCVGSCLWEPEQRDEELSTWLEAATQSGEPLLYVQHGRAFNVPPFWPYLQEALGGKPVRVAAALGRMNADAEAAPSNFFVRGHVPQQIAMQHAQGVVSGGNTTVVLGALTHGLPSVLVPSGGEQVDVAQRCERAGVALTLAPNDVTAETIGHAVNEILSNESLRARSTSLQQAFAAVNGFERAAELLETLGATGKPVLRGAESVVPAVRGLPAS